MFRALLTALAATFALALTFPPPAARGEEPAMAGGGKARVVVIPIQDEVSEAMYYLVRRALKDAAEQKIGTVVLDMKTPGGRSDAMFEIMEALDKFPGNTLTYVDDEAASAGALIAGATREIWFAPKAVMGAAAAVESGGEEIPETMKMKINSFFGAKVRTLATGKGRYRADTLRAMMDSTFEFKIGDTVINPKDHLLSVTTEDALQTYGDPPETLIGAGKADSLDDLLAKKFGAGKYQVTRIEATWSESLAVFLNTISPVLMSLGMLALFIEFKTPGFGVFGIAGIVLLGIVFLGNYVAGLSGYEPILAFGLGIVLIAVELLVFPGVVVAALTGAVLVVGALVWAGTDLWPGEGVGAAWSADAFVRPLVNLAVAAVLASGMIAAVVRYLPHSSFWGRLVPAAPTGGAAQRSGVAANLAGELKTLVGREAVAATDLRPSGFIEIDGRRLEARGPLETIPAGTKVRIVGTGDFAVEVARLPP